MLTYYYRTAKRLASMHSLLICIRIMHKIFLNSTLVLHIILHTLEYGY